MNKFEVVSEFQPKGDQPNAIKELKKGLDKNIPHQTLKGITGSGKSATIAWLIEECQLPSLVLAPNKALAAQKGKPPQSIDIQKYTNPTPRPDNPIRATTPAGQFADKILQYKQNKF